MFIHYQASIAEDKILTGMTEFRWSVGSVHETVKNGVMKIVDGMKTQEHVTKSVRLIILLQLLATSRFLNLQNKSNKL